MRTCSCTLCTPQPHMDIQETREHTLARQHQCQASRRDRSQAQAQAQDEVEAGRGMGQGDKTESGRYRWETVEVMVVVVVVVGGTYCMSVTLATSQLPMSWLNDEALLNIPLYVVHATATHGRTRDERTHVSGSASVSGESARPQSGSGSGSGRGGRGHGARGQKGSRAVQMVGR